jgi:hypothetical protein
MKEQEKKKHGCLKVVLGVIIVFAALIIGISLRNKMAEKKQEDAENSKILNWPDSDVGKMIPKPNTKNGEIIWEHEDSFDLYARKMSRTDYNNYVEKCKKRGFTKKYSKTDDTYYADNDKGYNLSLIYDENEKYTSICLKPKEETTEATTTTTAEKVTTTAKKKSTQTSGIRPRIKKAIDSYETVMDSYCKFMKKYNESSDTSSMMKDYSDYMEKYSDAAEKFEKIKDDNLNDDELAYYTKVQVRVTKKLADVQ